MESEPAVDQVDCGLVIFIPYHIKIQSGATVTVLIHLERTVLTECLLDCGHDRRNRRVDLFLDPRLLVARHEVSNRSHASLTLRTPTMPFQSRLSCACCALVGSICTTAR